MATIALNTVLSLPHFGQTQSTQQQITQTVERRYISTQVIGTSEEVIVVGADIATLGIARFTNKDSTNFVDVGPEVAGVLEEAWTLKAGESFTVRLKPGTTYRAKANTSPVNLDVEVYND